MCILALSYRYETAIILYTPICIWEKKTKTFSQHKKKAYVTWYNVGPWAKDYTEMQLFHN